MNIIIFILIIFSLFSIVTLTSYAVFSAETESKSSITIMVSISANLSHDWKSRTANAKNYVGIFTSNSRTMGDTYTTSDGVVYTRVNDIIDVSEQKNRGVLLGEYQNPNDSSLIAVIGQKGGVIAPADSSELFGTCENNSCEYFNLNNAQAMKYENIDLTYLDTSNVVNMAHMFANAQFNTLLNLTKFDTSNVESMEGMFFNNKVLRGSPSSTNNLDLNYFNTSKVTTMSQMFLNCLSLEYISMDNFDTRNVTNMFSMFCSCRSLKFLNLYAIPNFKVDNVKDLAWMFIDCQSLTDLNLNTFYTTSATRMDYMFSHCFNLKTLSIDHFDTTNVTSMSYMFENCYELEALYLYGFDTRKVTNMNCMFFQSSNLKTIKVNCNWSTSQATTENMFANTGTSSVEYFPC